jgi:hypothetical protein
VGLEDARGECNVLVSFESTAGKNDRGAGKMLWQARAGDDDERRGATLLALQGLPDGGQAYSPVTKEKSAKRTSATPLPK